MAKSTTFVYLEKWNTRQGVSERLVIRTNGRFSVAKVGQVSLTSLRKR